MQCKMQTKTDDAKKKCNNLTAPEGRILSPPPIVLKTAILGNVMIHIPDWRLVQLPARGHDGGHEEGIRVPAMPSLGGGSGAARPKDPSHGMAAVSVRRAVRCGAGGADRGDGVGGHGPGPGVRRAVQRSAGGADCGDSIGGHRPGPGVPSPVRRAVQRGAGGADCGDGVGGHRPGPGVPSPVWGAVQRRLGGGDDGGGVRG